MTRALVAGRVRFGETLRDALYRHIENDLGPMVFPQMAKVAPEKQAIDHRKKPTTMDTVLPERTAPSQMSPS